MSLDALVRRVAALPCWNGRVDIAPLDGGMTNRNFQVRDGSARFAVRLGEDVPVHGVMRFNELAAARAAHAAGVSPEVVFAAPGVMVSRFIEGRTLEPADLREPFRMPDLVALLRRCHEDIPRFLTGPALMFWVFQVIRNYAAVLRDRPGHVLEAQMPRLLHLAAQLEPAVGPVRIAFGHNDLLAGNFLDDGRRLWLIDWDYAGFNTPLFDLANLSVNNALAPEQASALLQAYLREPPDAATRRAFTALQCASLLREVLWGAVSQQISDIDFDYAAYTLRWLGQLDSAWEAASAAMS